MKDIMWVLHCLFHPVEYSAVDGQPYIREWFNRPRLLVDHLRKDHKLTESEVNDILLEVRKGKRPLVHRGKGEDELWDV